MSFGGVAEIVIGYVTLEVLCTVLVENVCTVVERGVEVCTLVELAVNVLAAIDSWVVILGMVVVVIRIDDMSEKQKENCQFKFVHVRFQDDNKMQL